MKYKDWLKVLVDGFFMLYYFRLSMFAGLLFMMQNKPIDYCVKESYKFLYSSIKYRLFSLPAMFLVGTHRGFFLAAYSSTVSRIFAGIPATTELSGTFFVTILPAAIIQFLPIVTPGIIIASQPIFVFSPILIFPKKSAFLFTRPRLRATHSEPSCVINFTPLVIRTFFPISIR